MEKSDDNLMSIAVYDKILADLKKVDYRGRIHLYLMGEPLCDEDIHTWIEWAREGFPENIIFISTNGDYLEKTDDITKLIESGLTWMAISNYDGNGRLDKLTEDFPNVVCASLEKLKSSFYNRGGNIETKAEQPRERCDWVFGKAYINYLGDVILCCSDYHYEVVFGNVLERPFPEIYNSPEYRKYRKEHAQGRGKTLPLCERCDRIQ
jgi:radical SAM protein with 4Fe4S-binding SPASM domain